MSTRPKFAQVWQKVGMQFLPFADVATADLPLAKLLRLSLFQAAIGITLALLVGTLNRVMIVELGVPAWWVALSVALPLVFAPLRALIGYRSDTHPSALGLRRLFCLTFETEFFGRFGFAPTSESPVDPETYAQLLQSGDEGVAEFLDLERVKPNTLGNTRMVLYL